MYNRVYDFLTENNILHEKQFGFQSAHSSEHAILQLSKRNSNVFNEKQSTDFSKAFDTEDHKILLKIRKNM